MDVDRLRRALREDRSSGAAELAARAAAAYAEVLRGSSSRDVDELRSELATVARAVLAAQPAMAPLLALGATVLRAVTGTADLESAREQTLRALAAFREHLERAAREVAARAEGLVPAGGHLLTLSWSSTVRAALLEAARRRSFAVLCLESRPLLEGRKLAKELAENGLQVTVAPDAAVASLIRGCDVVLVGADSIGELGVVNKIGTRAAALAARGSGIPVYALADTTKLLPPGYPQHPEDDRPPEEVWEDPPPGLRIWNRYFEATPLSLFAGIVIEQGLRTPAEIEELRARMEVPAELRPRKQDGAAGNRPAAP